MLRKKGFTLVELVVVLAILAVLALLIIGAIVIARRVMAESIHRSNARNMATALEAYQGRNRKYPDFRGSGRSLATWLQSRNIEITLVVPPFCPSSRVDWHRDYDGIYVSSGDLSIYGPGTYKIEIYDWECYDRIDAIIMDR